MKKIAIVGAGAMGSLFAAGLTGAGCEVTLIDVDRTRIELLNRQGLIYEHAGGDSRIAVRAMLAAECRGPVDLVLMLTKGMHTRKAALSVAHLAGPSCWALTLQNGIGNAEALADVFGADHVLLGATDYPADLKAPNRIATHGSGTVWIGAYAGAPWPAVQEATDLFGMAFAAVAEPQIKVKVWEKLAFNAALNALAAITRLTVGALDEPAGRRIAFAAVDEVVATAAASGLPLDRARIADKIENALRHHRDHKASMLQDLLAGRPTEIETINGAVVAVAQREGLGAPVNAVLADLVRLLEGTTAVWP